jgi:hypothetical protein
MKRSGIALFTVLVFLLSVTTVYAQGGSETSTPGGGGHSPGQAADRDTDGDNIPDSAEQLLGTNPRAADTDGDSIPDASDEAPLTTSVAITESSVEPFPLRVTDARVEDNFQADDHLEITLENSGQTDVSLTDCVITIADKGSADSESYYVDLAGFTVPARGKTTLHFDNGTGSSHFPGNTNGLYRTAADGLDFNVELHALGYKTAPIHVEKAPGTAEIAD